MENIRALDLVCFRGSDIISKSICLLETHLGFQGNFSHVGLVITKEFLNLPQLEPEKLYIWESTCSWPYVTDGTPNIVTGQAKLGVQIRDLELVIKNYLENKESVVAWCPLKQNPIDSFPNKVIEILYSLYQQYGKAGYETPWGLCAAICPAVMKIYSTLTINSDASTHVHPNFHGDRLFCSELVGLVYQQLGILIPTVNPSEVLPSYFLDKANIISKQVYLNYDNLNLLTKSTTKQKAKRTRLTLERTKSNKILAIKIEYQLFKK